MVAQATPFTGGVTATGVNNSNMRTLRHETDLLRSTIRQLYQVLRFETIPDARRELEAIIRDLSEP